MQSREVNESIRSERIITDILPSTELTEEQDNNILSDHAFRISRIPIGTGYVNAGTFNMLANANIFPGFRYRYPDTKQNLRDLTSSDSNYELWQKNRWEKMVEFVSQTAKIRELSLLSIQETIPDLRSMLLKKLNENLPEDEQWAFYSDPDSKNAPVAILYKKSEFKLENERIIKLDGNKCPCVALTHSATQEPIEAVALTIGHRPDEDPTTAENDLLKCASQNMKQKMIAIGDFNLRMANPGSELINCANNLIPPGFQKTAGVYDSTDAFIMVEMSILKQLPADTVDQLNPKLNISPVPILDVSTQESPYRRVFNPNGHLLPIGKGRGMNVSDFVKGLINDTKIEKNINVEVYAKIQTNEKQLVIRSNTKIPILEAMGIPYDFQNKKYLIEFAYPEIDKVMPISRNAKSFYFRDENKRINLACLGSHHHRVGLVGIFANKNVKEYETNRDRLILASGLYDHLESKKCLQNIESSSGDRVIYEENMANLIGAVKEFMSTNGVTNPKQIHLTISEYKSVYKQNKEMTKKVEEAIDSVLNIYSAHAPAPALPPRANRLGR